MPSVHLAPALEKVSVVRRGSFSVPREVATINCDCAFRKPCRGLALVNLGQEHSALELIATQRAKTMVARLAVRGQELHGDLWLHGPWASHLFEERLQDVDSAAFEQAKERTQPDGITYRDQSGLVAMVYERDPAVPVADYLLVGNFVMTEVRFDEPVTVGSLPW